ncbi:MAG TPA: hypothetical protein VKU44_11175, partial [Terriglobia bacterium]|nr:hypothetical protein [Terriglobia bacterium]
ASTLGLTVALEKLGTGNRAKLRIALDAHDVSFQNEKAGVKAVTLDFLVVQLAPDGTVQSNVLRTVHMGVAEKGFEQALKNGLALASSLDVEQGAAELRLVVRDAASGNLGSVSVPLGP